MTIWGEVFVISALGWVMFTVVYAVSVGLLVWLEVIAWQSSLLLNALIFGGVYASFLALRAAVAFALLVRIQRSRGEGMWAAIISGVASVLLAAPAALSGPILYRSIDRTQTNWHKSAARKVQTQLVLSMLSSFLFTCWIAWRSSALL